MLLTSKADTRKQLIQAIKSAWKEKNRLSKEKKAVVQNAKRTAAKTAGIKIYPKHPVLRELNTFTGWLLFFYMSYYFIANYFLTKKKYLWCCPGISIGTVIATAVFLKNIKRKKLPVEIIDKNFLKLTLVGLLGSRVGFQIEQALIYGSQYDISSLKNILRFWDNNWSLWSGILTFCLALFILATRYNKETKEWLSWLDAITTPLMTLLFFSHIGDFFEGLNYGKPSMTPWAVTFENFAVIYTVPIHPTQLYAALYTLGIILLLTKYKDYLDYLLPKAEGRTFILGVCLHSLLYFLEGFLRGDMTGMIGPLRISQLVNLIIFISAVVIIMIWKRHRIISNL